MALDNIKLDFIIRQYFAIIQTASSGHPITTPKLYKLHKKAIENR